MFCNKRRQNPLIFVLALTSYNVPVRHGLVSGVLSRNAIISASPRLTSYIRKGRLKMSKTMKTVAIVGAVAAAVTAHSTTTAEAASKEKCFGISLAGANDCAAGPGSLTELERDPPA